MNPRRTRDAFDAVVALTLLAGVMGICACLVAVWPPAWLAVLSLGLCALGLGLMVADLGGES